MTRPSTPRTPSTRRIARESFDPTRFRSILGQGGRKQKTRAGWGQKAARLAERMH